MRILSSTSKPMSSPGRTEKFPPPLMRFLRTKSRGKHNRTKYPLFLRRKKAPAIEAPQEPSSPKVTCIGQVRVTRSKSKSKPETSNSSLSKKPTKSCCCFCFEKPNLCNDVKICKPNLKKWVWFFNCRSVKVRTDSSKFGSNRFEEKEEKILTVVEEREKWSCMQEVEQHDETTSIKTPPKNALLLTRCRSAPYRSSSLACQFWGSPLKNTEEIENKNDEETNIALEIEHRDSTSNSRGDQDSLSDGRPIIKKCGEDLDICAENEHVKDKVLTCSSTSPTRINQVDHEQVASESRPVLLRRCKSEPRTSNLHKFDPESCDFWRLTTRLSNGNCNNVSESKPLSHLLP